MQHSYADQDLVGLIQYAIEEGTGEPCGSTDAENILNAWQQTA